VVFGALSERKVGSLISPFRGGSIVFDDRADPFHPGGTGGFWSLLSLLLGTSPPGALLRGTTAWGGIVRNPCQARDRDAAVQLYWISASEPGPVREKHPVAWAGADRSSHRLCSVENLVAGRRQAAREACDATQQIRPRTGQTATSVLVEKTLLIFSFPSSK